MMRTSCGPTCLAATDFTVRLGPALRQTPSRVGMPLPTSLSVGARQKFGISGLVTSSVPLKVSDSMAPVVLPMVTLNPSPLTR